MNLKPAASLSYRETTKGLDLVIKDGLAAEAMTVLTGGTFLVAMALLLGASNFQIGLLVALPTLTNVFQLLAIWLVQRYNNRRAVTVCSNMLARFPLLIIGVLPFIFTKGTSIQVLLFLLFFHYFFGSVAGASWNSWMKDLVPQQKLGTYFSHRSRLTQTLNVILSLVLALALDGIKKYYPGHELLTYSLLFVAGGVLGLLGTYILSRTPEPQSFLARENLLKLFGKPLRDRNYRNLLLFNSFWAFALNLATPFFTVFMMNALGLPLSNIIGFGILSQLAGIFAIKLWGRYSDQFSNKTIIRIAAPVYILCILGWSVVSLPSSGALMLLLVGVINVLSGFSTSGINLAIGNIGLKLAPKDEAIVYISARNMIVAFVSALGPLLGGWLADLLAASHFTLRIPYLGVMHNWNFLFVMGGLLAIVALRTLKAVKEEGEVEKEEAVAHMRVVFRSKMKERITKKSILSLLSLPFTYPLALKKKVAHRIERRVVSLRKWNESPREKRA